MSLLNRFRKQDKKLKPLEQNNYYTCYRIIIKEKIKQAGGKEEFFQYIDDTYIYSYNRRKEFEFNHFSSEESIIKFTFWATVLNALNVALSTTDVISDWKWVFGFLATVCTAWVSFIENRKMKRQYHETWLRHNIHYLDFIKECRDYAEDLGQYTNIVSNGEKYELFKKTLYQIEDNDLDRFSENTVRLK